MPWLLEEKQKKEQFKRALVVTCGLNAFGLLLSAWLTRDVRAAVRDGERTIASARDGYRTMAVLGLAMFVFGLLGWRDVATYPAAACRLYVASALALLVCAAIPAAALMAFPAPG